MQLRVLLISAVATLGCKSNKEVAKDDPGSRVTAGSGSAAPSGTGSGSGAAMPATKDPTPTGAAPTLTWKDSDGELLLASDGSALRGPCDMTGTLTPTEVSVGGATPQPWNVINRNGRKFSLERMDWVIEVLPAGEVVHSAGGKKTPLGVITGLDEATLPWFSAFIVAAPMIQHAVSLAMGNTQITAKGAADLRAWQIVNGANKLATREREDPAPLLFGDKPPWDAKKISVAPGTGKTYLVNITRDTDEMRAAFDADTYVVAELDGKLTYHAGPDDKKAQDKALGQLVMRKACAAHDRAVAALVWAAFATKDGHGELLGMPGGNGVQPPKPPKK